MSACSIQTVGLSKAFATGGREVVAVAGVDLAVEQGEIFGFLGPNGAGKTTTLRMLTTLLAFDQGTASVAGCDVATDPQGVRRQVGYVSQQGGADEEATGVDDLILQGRLYGMSRSRAADRARDLIDQLQLTEFATRRVKTYSGGQKRRLNVASGIVHQPSVLFLDEPTTGLDPQNRANLWEQVRRLRDSGATVFLTTHYLEEADALCDRVAIIDGGRVAVTGTPTKLKATVSADTVVVRPNIEPPDLPEIAQALAHEEYVEDLHVEGHTLRLLVRDGARLLPRLMSWFDRRGVQIETVDLTTPSLDDVFLLQTGRRLRDLSPEGARG